MSDEPVIRSRSRIPASPEVRTEHMESRAGAITPTTTSVRQAASAASGTDWMKSGAVAREVSATELARQQERERQRASGLFMPFRFWLPVGKQVELVILDVELGPCFYEHNLKDPRTGKYDVYESCPKEFEHCPLCDGIGGVGGKESYYTMMLTAMVLDPYINKNGVTVPHSRKLLAVRTNDQPFFHRQIEQAGSLRGRQYLMVRNNKNESNIGRPEFIAAHSEEAIMATFGHAQVVAQDGKVLKQANADCYAYPYAQLFHRPSGDDLRRRYGGMAPIGSGAANQQMLGDQSGVTATIGRTITPTTSNVSPEILDDDVPF